MSLNGEDRRGESGLAVVDVTDGADVHMNEFLRVAHDRVWDCQSRLHIVL